MPGSKQAGKIREGMGIGREMRQAGYLQPADSGEQKVSSHLGNPTMARGRLTGASQRMKDPWQRPNVSMDGCIAGSRSRMTKRMKRMKRTRNTNPSIALVVDHSTIDMTRRDQVRESELCI